MKFCSQCGALVSRFTPAGDTHERFVCDACQTIHYQNPKMVVGCIPEWEDRILLCRRAIEPRHGGATFEVRLPRVVAGYPAAGNALSP